MIVKKLYNFLSFYDYDNSLNNIRTTALWMSGVYKN